MLTKRDAIKAGRNAGKAAASWKFDGNTDDATYSRFMQGFEEGDPEVMDQFSPPSWLSGEWSGESMNDILGDCEVRNNDGTVSEALTLRNEERQNDIATAYEEAADNAYWNELQRTARYHVR